MPNPDIFCNSPWYELHVYWDGSLGFCCHATPQVPYPEKDKPIYNIQNMSIGEWYNSEPMQQARQRMLGNSKWDHCRRCYLEEQVSPTSRRHRSNQKSVIFRENFQDSFEQSPGYNKFVQPNGEYNELPIDLHIDLGNYCNLACKMCNPFASSKIASQHKVWKLLDVEPRDWTQNQQAWDKFLNDLIKIPKLKNIHFMGGETLIQPRFEECIDYLLHYNRTDVCISFVTNGTVYNQNLIQKLKKFSRLGLELSIESLSESNVYTRQGTDNQKVIANINRYLSECSSSHISLTLRPAPSLLTVRDYWQVIKLALERGLTIKSTICSEPEFLDISLLPLDIRDSYKENYKKLLDDFCLVENTDVDYNESNPHNFRLIAKNQITQILNLLDQPVRLNQKKLLTQLVQHIVHWDRVYQYDARIVYPELASLLEEYGYQV